jgi:HD superfamily phosphohydrolase
MSRGRIQRVQDSVHGLMEYAGMETLVVDVLRTPEIQRLRRIRQLGLVHLVFPGAEHSRLVHSLGASHLAVRFGRQLRQIARERIIPLLAPDESVVRDFALGALCHDLGHGPLSHAWEREVIGENFDRNNWTQALGLTPSDPLIAHLKWHELVVQG